MQKVAIGYAYPQQTKISDLNKVNPNLFKNNYPSRTNTTAQ